MKNTPSKKYVLIKNIRVLYKDGSNLYGSKRNCIYISSDFGDTWTYSCKIHMSWGHRFLARFRILERLLRLEIYKLQVTKNYIVILAKGGVYSGRKNEPVIFKTWNADRGSRPISLCVTPDEQILIGEYHSNPERDPVNIYRSHDASKWEVGFTFPAGSIRHIHGIYFDKFRTELWILTGDYEHEAAIYRAPLELSSVQCIRSGSQLYRAYSCIIDENGIYYATDTEVSQNFICYLSANGEIHKKLAPIEASAFHSCKIGDDFFFSTVCEPSICNDMKNLHIWRLNNGELCQSFHSFQKDCYPMVAQYGNVFFPEGDGPGNDYLYVSGSAIKKIDGHTLRMSIM